MTTLPRFRCTIIILCLLVIVPLLSPQSPVSAACDPISSKTLRVSSTKAQNGTLTAKVRGSTVCDVGIDIKYQLPFWGELTVNPADTSWISIAGGKNNFMRGGLIPPNALVAFRVRFSPDHRGVRFTINSISDRARLMNFFQSALDIAAPIPGAGGIVVGELNDVLEFMAEDYSWIIQSFDRMPHLANIAKLKPNMTKELEIAWNEGEFGTLAQVVRQFYDKYRVKVSKAFLEFGAEAAKRKADRLLFKKVLTSLNYLKSFTRSISKLYTLGRGFRSGFIEYAYIPATSR